MKVFLFLIVTLVSCTISKSIDADDPLIHYYGRIDFSNPKIPVYDWPGTVIEATFSGTSLALIFAGAETRYNVSIDGGESTVLVTASSSLVSYPISSSLSEGTHHVRIEKRGETTWYSSSFGGFELDDSSTLTIQKPKPSQKIEFIGDSYSVGYGVESPSRDGDDSAYQRFTNISKDYTVLTAKHFEAQYMVTAISGKGLVQNRLHDEPGMTIPYLYDYLLQSVIHTNKPLTKWDSEKYQPDLIVINLGTNDFASSTSIAGADSELFIKGYREFLAKLRSLYPSTKFVLCASYMWPDNKLIPAVQSVISQEKSEGNLDCFYYDFTGKDDGWSALDWHPSVSQQRGIADGLIAVIEKENLLKPKTAVVHSSDRAVIVPMQIIDRSVTLNIQENRSDIKLLCHTVQGKECSRLYEGSISPGNYTFTIPKLAAGTYLITLQMNGMNCSTAKVAIH